MKLQPKLMSRMTMATLVMTMMPLTNADSFMPRIRSSDSMRMMNSAGTFMMPRDTTAPFTSFKTSNGEWHQANGIVGEPGMNSSSLFRYSDQAMPTVAAPMPYSSTKSHPMIHATSSPSVAYA